MLDTTRRKLDSMYRGEPQPGRDGALHEIDKSTRISVAQGELLATFHQKIRPKVSIEVGMAYGFSTLFIADSMHEHHYGYHLAIDPFQASHWHGIATTGVQELGFEQRVRHVNELSVAGLTRMHEQGVRADYVFIDGQHTFDSVLVDFFCTDRLLNIGGIVLFDDMWMPSIRKVASYVRANFPHYSEVPTPVANVFCVLKNAEDARRWDHFIDFN